jgi:hypothetical protein
VTSTTKWKRRLVVAVVATLVGAYDLWAVRVTGLKFNWGFDLSEYYDLLGRAFAAGHLYLPIQPSPQLLAQPNPWDPNVDWRLKLNDAVLFNGRYYLYFGAAPAVLLFTPWRLATGHDLPQNFGLFVFAFGGFLFACSSLLGLLDLAGVRPGSFVLALLLLALGVCQGVPYLLSRPDMYEVAIACGYFCTSAGVFFLARGVASRQAPCWLAASGLMFGLAVASRPHLVFTGLTAATGLAVLFVRRRGYASGLRSRGFLAFCVAYMLVGAVVAAYNYARFGNPLEFGFTYQLAGPGQNRLDFSTRNLIPGLYFMLLSRPELSPVFPWMRMVFRFPFDSTRYPLPPDYFIEPSIGALWIAPFVVAAVFIPSTRWLTLHSKAPSPSEARTVRWTATAGCIAVLVFLISNHLSTQRYEVDFLPLGVWGAAVTLGIYVSLASGFRRHALTAFLATVVLYSAVANLALGIGGPYFEFLKNRPRNYVRLARWFSPFWETRPVINPAIDITMRAALVEGSPDFREPLITIGHSHYAYFLYAEQLPGTLRLVSQSGDFVMSYEMADPRPRPLTIGMTYCPETRIVAVTVDGNEVLAHPVEMLITAPAEVALGENFSDPVLASRRFPGRLQVLKRTISERTTRADSRSPNFADLGRCGAE